MQYKYRDQNGTIPYRVHLRGHAMGWLVQSHPLTVCRYTLTCNESCNIFGLKTVLWLMWFNIAFDAGSLHAAMACIFNT